MRDIEKIFANVQTPKVESGRHKAALKPIAVEVFSHSARSIGYGYFKIAGVLASVVVLAGVSYAVLQTLNKPTSTPVQTNTDQTQVANDINEDNQDSGVTRQDELQQVENGIHVFNEIGMQVELPQGWVVTDLGDVIEATDSYQRELWVNSTEHDLEVVVNYNSFNTAVLCADQDKAFNFEVVTNNQITDTNNHVFGFKYAGGGEAQSLTQPSSGLGLISSENEWVDLAVSTTFNDCFGAVEGQTFIVNSPKQDFAADSQFDKWVTVEARTKSGASIEPYIDVANRDYRAVIEVLESFKPANSQTATSFKTQDIQIDLSSGWQHQPERSILEPNQGIEIKREYFVKGDMEVYLQNSPEGINGFGKALEADILWEVQSDNFVNTTDLGSYRELLSSSQIENLSTESCLVKDSELDHNSAFESIVCEGPNSNLTVVFLARLADDAPRDYRAIITFTDSNWDVDQSSLSEFKDFLASIELR